MSCLINGNAVYYNKLVNHVQYSVFRRIVFLSNYRTRHDPAQLDSLAKVNLLHIRKKALKTAL